MSRGERLQAEKNKKAKMRRVLSRIYVSDKEQMDGLLGKKSIGKAAHAPHPCSGRCCGNPRCFCKGKDKLTRQELREKEREKE